MVDLYKSVKGIGVTRETRMEVVAWIAVCQFQCKLEGGFVRDLVVGNHQSHPSDNPQPWIQYQNNTNGRSIPYMREDIVPTDLDCHLPLNKYFDIDKFQDELETVVDNTINKRFQVLRLIDKLVRIRIDKMNRRHWTQIGESIDNILRPPPKHYTLLVPLSNTSTLYQALLNRMNHIGSVTIVSIEEIRNPLLEDAYESMKKIIVKECPNHNPNEHKLFHGTKGDAIKGIVEDGYDDRFFSQGGAWGTYYNIEDCSLKGDFGGIKYLFLRDY